MQDLREAVDGVFIALVEAMDVDHGFAFEFAQQPRESGDRLILVDDVRP